MPKQTRLGDNAEIYMPRKKQTEKEKLSDLPLKKKIVYLWDYYRIHAFVVIAVIALTLYIIYSIITPRVDTKFYGAFINNNIDNQVLTDYGNDFSEHLQLDPKTEATILNSFYTEDYNMEQVLGTFIAASEVDVIIAPKSVFANFAYSGYFDKLSNQLPTDLYSSMTDRFYISDLDDDTEKNVYGIYLAGSGLYKNNENSADPYVLGILANSKHNDNAVEFIRYLFQLYP